SSPARATAVVADAPIKFAISTDADTAAVVVTAERGKTVDQDGLVDARISHGGVANDLLFAAGNGDEDIDVTVDHEILVEADAEQSAFAAGIDRAERCERRP